MRSFTQKSVTLLELLISIVLIGLVILGLSNIESFCRNQLLSSDRRLKVQNEASFVLDHMAKQIGRAISDPESDPIIVPVASNCFKVLVDANGNGVLDKSGASLDNFIAYRYNTATHLLDYCPNMSLIPPPAENACMADGDCSGGAWETLSRHVTSAMNSANIIYSNSSNYVEINITACADPGSANPCGGMRNPSVNMKSSVIMPSVSTR